MKKLSTIFLIALASFGAFCQDLDFTGAPNFKTALLAIPGLDKNRDGEIQVKEAEAVTGKLDVSNKKIASLVHIGVFQNVTELVCSKNLLTTLDLSLNTELTELHCDGNQLTYLNLTSNSKLIKLQCLNNQLTSLDVSRNVELQLLSCGSNPSLTSLDVSRNVKLKTLGCYKNGLTSLDVSRNVELENLYCSSNSLTYLNLTSNSKLIKLQCFNNQLTSLDVSRNVELTQLFCYSNPSLTSLDVSRNVKLKAFSCYKNGLTSLDVSRNVELENLYCSSNSLTYLNLTSNSKLIKLQCFNNQLTSLDVSRNVDLENLYCSSNSLTYLNLTSNSKLIKLRCSSNQLTSLDVSRNVELTELFCHSNPLLESINLKNVNILSLVSTRRVGKNSIPGILFARSPKLKCVQMDRSDMYIFTKAMAILMFRRWRIHPRKVIKSSCFVQVTSITVSGKGGKTNIATEDGTLQMEVVAEPTGATDKGVAWSVAPSSGSKGRATIDTNGLLTAVLDGKVTVTATARDGSATTATKEITITNNPLQLVTSITVSGKGGKTNIATEDGILQMEVDVKPTGATDKGVDWSVDTSSGSKGRATIDTNGLLTAVLDGRVTVTATAKDGSGTTATKEITITNNPLQPVTRITVRNAGDVSAIDILATLQMRAEVLPADATRTVRWSVDDESVATIHATTGVLTAKSTGTVRVTATAGDRSGVTGTKDITISKEVKSITVRSAGDVNAIDIKEGTLQMRADVEPSDATNNTVRWSVDNESVAIIDETTGVLTAKSTGTVRVTATARDRSGVTGTKDITITKQVKSITVRSAEDVATIDIKEGTLQMRAEVLPADATDNTVRWSVDDESVATIHATTGVLTAKSTGTVRVTATAEDAGGVTGTKDITISKEVKSITVRSAGDVNAIDILATLQMRAEVLPADATSRTVRWSVDDESVATIHATTGVLTAKSTGTVRVTATAEDAGGVTGTKDITISKEVKSITVKSAEDVATIDIKEGTLQMRAEVLPADATDNTVRWSVDNTAIATIHETTGVLTLKSTGTVRVTATAEDAGGVTGTKDITITKEVKSITVRSEGDVAERDIKEGILRMTAEVLPTDATNKNPQWSVDDESKATIGATTGVLTPKSTGTVTITATARDASGVKGTKDITITDAIDESSVRQITRITVRSAGDVATIPLSNGTLQMRVEVEPADATNKNPQWSVDDTAIATIDAITGVLTAKSQGTVIITATAKDASGVKGTKQITITKEVESITVRSAGDVATIDIEEGTLPMRVEVLPADATNRNVSWSVDDESKATIGATTGVLTLKSTGTVRVTATAGDGSRVTGTKDITITKEVESITVRSAGDVATIDIEEGTLRMTADVEPADATNRNVSWSVNNLSIATIDETTGVLTAKSTGTVIITATARDASEVKGTKQITITKEVESITVRSAGDVATIDIEEGTLQMRAEVLPADATNRNVSWSVNNAAIATIDETTGVLTPKSKGTVIITATARDASEIKGTKQITITKEVKSITVKSAGDVATIAIKEGTLQMRAEVLPSDATSRTVRWSVSDGNIASINEDTGMLTFISKGTVTVKATARDASGVKGTKQITITDNPAPVVTGIAEDAAEKQLMIYPNPAGDIVIIKATDRIVESVTIQDLTGTIVKSLEKNTHSVDISSLRSGTYLLRVKTDNAVFTKKFVKQ